MLKVGIHDNLVIKSTTKNEQGILAIAVKKMTEVDPLEALSSAGRISFDQEEQKFLIYPPRLTTRNNIPLSHKDVMGLLAEVVDPLDHIVCAYKTKPTWNIYGGTGLNKDNIQTELLKEEVVNKIYGNIVDQFIKEMEPFVGENGKKVRMLFVRKSPLSHFPKFRTKFLANQPFIEPMDVPVSKLAFSPYEKERKLDDPNPVDGAQSVDQADASRADTLFK